MKALIERGLAAPCEVHAEQDWRLRSAPLEANAEQQTAINAISAAAGGFSVHLLYGVTGSGKTEVYLQSIAACLTRGEQALVLLPEIALTPQTLSRFESRFAAPIVTLHSGMGMPSGIARGLLPAKAVQPSSLAPGRPYLCR